jgi:hypothetical protein
LIPVKGLSLRANEAARKGLFDLRRELRMSGAVRALQWVDLGYSILIDVGPLSGNKPESAVGAERLRGARR